MEVLRLKFSKKYPGATLYQLLSFKHFYEESLRKMKIRFKGKQR